MNAQDHIANVASLAASAASSAAIGSMANKFTVAGSGLMIGSWIVSSEFGVLIGIFVGVGGLLVNWYYKHRENKRAERQDERTQQQHDREMLAAKSQFMRDHDHDGTGIN